MEPERERAYLWLTLAVEYFNLNRGRSPELVRGWLRGGARLNK